MSEAKAPLLEQKRFVINPESMDGMKALRTRLNELRNDYPYLSGLAFFGSRTKGTEILKSDYDVCIFYNSERLEFLHGTRDEWNNILESLTQQVNTHLDHRVYDRSAGLRIDISQENTDRELGIFREEIHPFIDKDIDQDLIIRCLMIPPVQNLYSRFFLAVGDEVYDNRKYILDQLKADPNGEKYFQILMGTLAVFERSHEPPPKQPSPPYKRYPQTIEEAEKYFVNR